MADARNIEQQRTSEPASGDVATALPATSATSPRKAYRAPHVRHLGSVRELTWGDAGRYADGVIQQSTP